MTPDASSPALSRTAAPPPTRTPRRCPYCRARLATVSCPSCFALDVRRRGLLPQVRRARESGAGRTTRRPRCPACRGGLAAVDVGSTPLLECGACDGVWVDADVFERLCAEREAQAAVLHRWRRAPA